MTIQLQFLGAAGGVTGSRTLLKFDGSQVLIDCGLFQGPSEVRQKNWDLLIPGDLKFDAVILTHAHLDHSGYLPRLFRQGWRGPVYCSEGTADLLPVMLKDAAHLEAETAKYANKTGYSRHKPALPLFTEQDVDLVLSQIKPQKRGEWLQLGRDVSVRFGHAGHIIGASTLQFALNYENGSRILTFSGDIGSDRSLTMRPPDPISETDVLVIESTYGDRLHPRHDTVKEFAQIAKRTFDRNGVFVIPAFAVGRAQEILYMIRLAEDQGLIPAVPVILDSPMAIMATKVFFDHPEDHREESLFSGTGGRELFLPRHFKVTESSDESMLACMQDGPLIVISAAGMLNGGRILHHLKARLPHDQNTVLFCGYQAAGTKGRILQERAGGLEKLRIHHEEVPIEAEIATIETLSAHGDWQDLLAWVQRISHPPSAIVINHGDPAAMIAMAAHLQDAFPKCKITPMLEPGKISFF